MKTRILLTTYLLLLHQLLSAQQLSEESEISLLTYTPSHNLYAAFGHSAIRVRDPAINYDMVYNYGMRWSDLAGHLVKRVLS